MGQSDAQLYRDLARTSGGQAIEVSKSDLSVATAVIQDSTASAVVSHWTRESHLNADDTAKYVCKNVTFLFLPL